MEDSLLQPQWFSCSFSSRVNNRPSFASRRVVGVEVGGGGVRSSEWHTHKTPVTPKLCLFDTIKYSTNYRRRVAVLGGPKPPCPERNWQTVPHFFPTRSMFFLGPPLRVGLFYNRRLYGDYCSCRCCIWWLGVPRRHCWHFLASVTPGIIGRPRERNYSYQVFTPFPHARQDAMWKVPGWRWRSGLHRIRCPRDGQMAYGNHKVLESETRVTKDERWLLGDKRWQCQLIRALTSFDVANLSSVINR